MFFSNMKSMVRDHEERNTRQAISGAPLLCMRPGTLLPSSTQHSIRGNTYKGLCRNRRFSTPNGLTGRQDSKLGFTNCK